jgi:hypothetical protein
MFPTTNKPLSALLRRGMDRAVEFATLGEYGVPAVPEPTHRRRPVPAQPWRPARTASQVLPATPAARRHGKAAMPATRRHGDTAIPATRRRGDTATPPARRHGEPAKRIPTRAAVRALAMRPAQTSAAGPHMRTRAGQPTPRTQPCIAP